MTIFIWYLPVHLFASEVVPDRTSAKEPLNWGLQQASMLLEGHSVEEGTVLGLYTPSH